MPLTQRLQQEDIERAAALLKMGEVIAFPTETVYGLGACIFQPDAIAKIFTLKGRPADNPLIVHISDVSDIERIAVDIPPAFYKLADVFFPGPCTLVLKRHPRVPSIVSGGLETIAVRMPSHPMARELIASVGEPLAAPSANLSGRPSATSCDHVLEDFSGKISAVLDGGKTKFGIESTVVSLLHVPPMLLRPGTITKHEIENALGTVIDEASAKENQKALSPGMKYRHYCPSTPMRMFDSRKTLLLAAAQETRPMVLSFEKISIPHGDHFLLSAKEFYALLRFADTEQYSAILILCEEPTLQDSGLMNRLFRACGLN